MQTENVDVINDVVSNKGWLELQPEYRSTNFHTSLTKLKDEAVTSLVKLNKKVLK